MRPAARLLKNRDGATAIEYALIGGLLSILLVAGATAIGQNLTPIFATIAAGFTN